MDISFFGFKFNLIILLLIGIIYLIMVGHTLCGCCNMPLIMESFTANRNNNDSKRKVVVHNKNTSNDETTETEGFVGANTNFGESSKYTLGDYSSVDTSSWGMPTLTVTPGKPLSKAVQDILNRPEQPVPLPEGEMLMFANTKFAPEFCPNTYSNSSGCAEMTSNQYNYLVTRGGNNVPYSEY